MIKNGHLQRGMSFIEIMVVVLIMGLLLTLIAPNVMRFFGGAKETKAKADLRGFKLNIDSYYEEVGAYPKDLAELYQKPNDQRIAKLWKGPYMEQKLVESLDPWKKNYEYQLTPKGAHPYELWSWGDTRGDEGAEDKKISVWDI